MIKRCCILLILIKAEGYSVGQSRSQSLTRRGWFSGVVTTSLVAQGPPAWGIGEVDRWVADPANGKVCLKRDLLGKCAEYGENGGGTSSDGDFVVSDTQRRAIAAIEEEDAGNDFIMKLRKQSIDNAARNKEEVAMKSFENSQAGEFGPFSRFLAVRKFDGTYELMTYSTYGQKEKLGEVKDKKYIIDIDALVQAKQARDAAAAAGESISPPRDPVP